MASKAPASLVPLEQGRMSCEGCVARKRRVRLLMRTSEGSYLIIFRPKPFIVFYSSLEESSEMFGLH